MKKWEIKSSWTYGKKESVEVLMELASDEEKYGKIIGLKIVRLKWPLKVLKDKSKWLVIRMNGAKEQEEACDEYLLRKMNGTNDE